MDELSPLLEQVRFHESWRGYDPSEVDAYIERVTNAAVWARSRIETLSELVETESAGSDEPVDSEREASAADGAPTAEELARSLALAKEDADEAVAKAREQAKQMVADAENRAQALIASANAEGTRIRREADDYAASTFADVENLATEREAAAAAAERERHAGAIAELTAERARQEEDLKLFERQVAERREEVERSLSRLVEVVESAEIFQTVQAPLNGHSESVVAVVDSGTATAAADLNQGDAESAEVAGDCDSPKLESNGSRVETSHSTEPSHSTTAEPDDIVSLDASAVFDDEIDSLFGEPLADVSDTAHAESVEPNQPQPRFVTLEDLQERSGYDESADSLGVEPAPQHSQLFDEAELSSVAARRREEEPFLTQLREAASRDNIRTDTDDALSAFFNQEEDQRRSPWFLGGR